MGGDSVVGLFVGGDRARGRAHCAVDVAREEPDRPRPVHAVSRHRHAVLGRRSATAAARVGPRREPVRRAVPRTGVRGHRAQLPALGARAGAQVRIEQLPDAGRVGPVHRLRPPERADALRPRHRHHDPARGGSLRQRALVRHRRPGAHAELRGARLRACGARRQRLRVDARSRLRGPAARLHAARIGRAGGGAAIDDEVLGEGPGPPATARRSAASIRRYRSRASTITP